MIWWAIESKAASDREAVLALVEEPETWKRPIVRDVLIERLARRYVALGEDGGYAACAWLLEHAPTEPDVERIVDRDGDAAGRPPLRPAAPVARGPLARVIEPVAAVDPPIRAWRIRLGSQEALPKLVERAKEPATKPAERLTAIRALSEAGPRETPCRSCRSWTARKSKWSTRPC